MKTYFKKTVPVALLALAAFATRATPTDEFLAELARIDAGEGSPAALTALTNHLATAKPAPADLAKCNAELVKLLVATKQPDKAGALLVDELVPSPAASSGLLLPALKKYAGSSDSAYNRQCACLAALKVPAFAAKNADRAEALQLLAGIYIERSFCDLAIAKQDEAIACCGPDDTDLKVRLLFSAAKTAQYMRRVDAAAKYFQQVQTMKGVPYATARRALLLEGMNYIYIDQYDWIPDPERLKKADELINKAIDAKPSAIKNEDAYQARVTLMKAYHCAKSYQRSIEIGRSLVDAPPKTSGLPVAATALYLADVLTEAKQFKLAIRYYERSLEGGGNMKNIHKKIGTAARGAGDYARAIQAYTDALPYCDWVEGKDEINTLKRMAATLSKAIRGKAKATSAEDLFSEESEEITNLQLDEL